jgi:hypothetical protein
MKLIKEVNPVQTYLRGSLAAYMESISMSTPLTDRRVDEIKEKLKHFCEKKIDDSQLSNQEKEEQKRQMKQSLEVYIQGVKDENKFGK